MLDIVPSVDELCRRSSKLVESCAICSKSIQGQSGMKRHLRRSHQVFDKNDEEKRYFCPLEECSHSKSKSMPFFSLAAVKQHYKLVHGSERYKCHRCDRAFKSKYSCKQHAQECGVLYVCSCNVKYTTKRGLVEHAKRQNHQIPSSLQNLFKKKPLKRKDLVPAKSMRPTCNIILPKTLKEKIRVFRLIPSKVIQPTPRASGEELEQDSECVVATSNVWSGGKMADIVDSSTQVNASYRPTLPQQPSSLIDSPHKSISIQTGQILHNVDWAASSDVSSFFENIGTQTIESNFDPATETDSTFCQTELPSSSDALQSLWNSSYYTDIRHQQPATCDAQNQTVHNLSSINFHHEQGFQEAFPNERFSADHISTRCPINIGASIETQTESSVNLSAQTQTNHSFIAPGHAEAEVSPLDVFLNDIETQTDFLMPSLDSPSAFVNSCTQTTEPDFLSDILQMV